MNYRIEKNEDTGKQAIYKRSEVDGVEAWLLIDYEDNFWEILSVVSNHFTRVKNVSPDEE